MAAQADLCGDRCVRKIVETFLRFGLGGEGEPILGLMGEEIEGARSVAGFATDRLIGEGGAIESECNLGPAEVRGWLWS